MSRAPPAEQLIALAAAHGVDLIKAARIGAAKPKRDVRLMKFEGGRRAYVLLQPSGDEARGKATRSSKRPSYTLAELGQAARGVPQMQFWAACYAFAGARGYFDRLRIGLTREAVQIQHQNCWPETVTDIHGLARPYIPWLAKLILDEDFCPNEFAVCPQLYAWYLQISERSWDREVASRYFALRFVWLRWLGTAASMIQSRLSEHPAQG
jgi:hypothetical protein